MLLVYNVYSKPSLIQIAWNQPLVSISEIMHFEWRDSFILFNAHPKIAMNAGFRISEIFGWTLTNSEHIYF